jgi:hypothetical protein
MEAESANAGRIKLENSRGGYNATLVHEIKASAWPQVYGNMASMQVVETPTQVSLGSSQSVALSTYSQGLTERIVTILESLPTRDQIEWVASNRLADIVDLHRSSAWDEDADHEVEIVGPRTEIIRINARIGLVSEPEPHFSCLGDYDPAMFLWED